MCSLKQEEEVRCAAISLYIETEFVFSEAVMQYMKDTNISKNGESNIVVGYINCFCREIASLM